MIKYIDLSVTKEQYQNEISPLLEQVFTQGNFVGGEEVERFEKNFAEYIRCKYAVGVASGTDALILALKTLGIGSGDEVITVSNSFIATTNAIEWVGAKAVFVDVKENLLIDPAKIEEAITKKTKAVMPVHLMGLPCEMETINEIAKRHNLFVIEDAAQSVGSTYKGVKTGNLGDIGCFSLHPLKNLSGIGDGGIITTNDEKIAVKLKMLRNNGLLSRDKQAIIGRVSRLDTLNAAVLDYRLRKIDDIVKTRRENAKLYYKLLKNIKEIEMIYEDENSFHSYHTFIIKAKRREELVSHLHKCKIETKIHYPTLIHHQKPFQNREYNLPISEKLVWEILTLPLGITQEEITIVANEIHNFYRDVV